MGAFLRLMRFNAFSKSISEAVLKQTLKSASEALMDANDRLFAIDVSLDGAQRSIEILRNLLQSETSCRLDNVVKESVALTEDLLDTIGGASVFASEESQLIATPHSNAVFAFSSLLSMIVGAMNKKGLNGRLAIKITKPPSKPEIVATTPLPYSELKAICRKFNKRASRTEASAKEREIRLGFSGTKRQ